jgi:AcrR family transcriptional regulator
VSRPVTSRVRARRRSPGGQGPEDCAPGPLTKRGRETRRKLVASAAHVFSQAGFDDVRVTDITAHAGVASGTFYTYFTSKDEIFREVAAAVLHEMATTPTHDPDNVQFDPVRDIAYATREYFLCCARNYRVARSIAELQFRDRKVGEDRDQTLLKGVRRIAGWIEWLQRKGLGDPSVDPWLTALSLHAMNVSTAFDQFVYRERHEDLERLVQAITEIWRRALGLQEPGEHPPV